MAPEKLSSSGVPQKKKYAGIYKGLIDEVWEISLLPPDPSWKFTA